MRFRCTTLEKMASKPTSVLLPQSVPLTQRVIKEEWEALQKREREDQERRDQARREKEVTLPPPHTLVVVVAKAGPGPAI